MRTVPERTRKNNPNHDKKGRFSSSPIPAAPGTVSIPKGHIRAYHWTNADPDQIKQEGLLLSRALGHTYGEPDLVWGSTSKPENGFNAKPVVEFHVPAEDLSGTVETPRGQDPEEWQKGYHHIGLRRDVRPDEIIAVHEPWHEVYHGLNDRDGIEYVLSGALDSYVDDPMFPDQSKAIRRIKEEHEAKKNMDYKDPEAHVDINDPSYDEWTKAIQAKEPWLRIGGDSVKKHNPYHDDRGRFAKAPHQMTRDEYAAHVGEQHGVTGEQVKNLDKKHRFNESLYGKNRSYGQDVPDLGRQESKELMDAGLTMWRKKGWGASHQLTPKGRAVLRDYQKHHKLIVDALRAGKDVPEHVKAENPAAAKEGSAPKQFQGELTAKLARENLPPKMAQVATEFMERNHTRSIGFEHADRVYFGEDSKYKFYGPARSEDGRPTGDYTELNSFSVGGEWGGMGNVNAIGKSVEIPVGGYAVETYYKIGGGRGMRMYHNSGTALLKSIRLEVWDRIIKGGKGSGIKGHVTYHPAPGMEEIADTINEFQQNSSKNPNSTKATAARAKIVNWARENLVGRQVYDGVVVGEAVGVGYVGPKASPAIQVDVLKNGERTGTKSAMLIEQIKNMSSRAGDAPLDARPPVAPRPTPPVSPKTSETGTYSEMIQKHPKITAIDRDRRVSVTKIENGWVKVEHFNDKGEREWGGGASRTGKGEWWMNKLQWSPAPVGPKLPKHVETMSNHLDIVNALEGETSPENFWQDGEKPNTAANRREWAKLQREQSKRVESAQKDWSKLTDQQKREVVRHWGPEATRTAGWMLEIGSRELDKYK